MSASIKVTNRSDWPTWLVRWIVRRACADAGVTRYHWTQKSMTRARFWWGRGGTLEGYGAVWRRCLKAANAYYCERDHRFKDGHGGFWIPHTSVACLAFLIRHEVEHAQDGHPLRFRRGGRVDHYTMEYVCNGSAYEFVKSLEANWSEHFREWLALARKERKRGSDAMVGMRQRRQEARRLMLDKWERRLKLAQTKVKKYRRAVAAQERRAAKH